MTPVSIRTLSDITEYLTEAAKPLKGEQAELVRLAQQIVERLAKRDPHGVVCSKCGCSHFDPCEDPSFGPCAWAKPGLCTACTGDH